MLTSRTEKELSGEFERERRLAMEDSSGFAESGEQYSLEDLGVGVKGQGVNDPLTYKTDSNPIDNLTPSQKNAVDIREIPGHD